MLCTHACERSLVEIHGGSGDSRAQQWVRGLHSILLRQEGQLAQVQLHEYVDLINFGGPDPSHTACRCGQSARASLMLHVGRLLLSPGHDSWMELPAAAPKAVGGVQGSAAQRTIVNVQPACAGHLFAKVLRHVGPLSIRTLQQPLGCRLVGAGAMLTSSVNCMLSRRLPKSAHCVKRMPAQGSRLTELRRAEYTLHRRCPSSAGSGEGATQAHQQQSPPGG